MKKVDIHKVGATSPGTTWENIRTRLMENDCRNHDRLLGGVSGLMLHPSQNVSRNNGFPCRLIVESC